VTSINEVIEPHRDRLRCLSDRDLLNELNVLDGLPDATDPQWLEGSPLWGRMGEFGVRR
jgi:hypothetical protein